MWGEVKLVVASGPVFALERRLADAVLYKWFVTGNAACLLDLADSDGLTVIKDYRLVGGEWIGSRVSLPSFGVLFARAANFRS